MAQHDAVIDNQSGSAFRGDLNDLIEAILTLMSGTSAPSPTWPNMWWADTTDNRLKRRNNANGAWIDCGPIGSLVGWMPVSTHTTGQTAGVADRGELFDYTTAGVTHALTAAATLGDGHYHAVRNSAGSGVITIDPNGAETIDGSSTLVLNPGESAIVVCNGTAFKSVGRSYGAASETVAGVAELATAAEGNAGTDDARILTPKKRAESIFNRGYLFGLTLSNNGSDATNDLDIAAGIAADSASPYRLMELAASITKRLDAAWAVGTGNGGLDTGSIANTTYHVWLIRRSDTGVVDVLFSESASSPTMPANYDQKRRIGSFIRTAGTIVAFSQNGDEFLRHGAILDVNAANPGTSAVTRTLSVPTGIAVWALINVAATNTGTGVNFSHIISELDRTDEAPSTSAAPLTTLDFVQSNSGTVQTSAARLAIRTNTSAQIRSRAIGSDGNCTLRIATFGWIDRRGRDA